MAIPEIANDELGMMSETNFLIVAGELDASRLMTTLRLENGRIVQLPTALFDERPDPSVRLNELHETDEMVALPVIEEQLVVGKKTIETGKVRLDKQIHEYSETLDIPLAVRSYDIERVVLNRPVDIAPSTRQEGDTTIYPLVEEQLVITTQLVLKEELRVTRRDTEHRDTRTVTLKRESIEVTRTPLIERP